MTEKDEDIDIIDPPEGHQNFDSPPTFVIKSGIDDNPRASHHALFQAYEDIKRKHQQLKSQYDILRQTVVDMEYSRQGVRTHSNIFGAAGPAGASPADQDDQNAQVKAQIGYAESVQRQLTRAQAKIISLENENKELKSRCINNKNSVVHDSSALLQQKIMELNTRNVELNTKNVSLTERINREVQLSKEKDEQIERLGKQKDPTIMTGPFVIKIQELKTEIREKDEHIAALMERLKTVTKGYESKQDKSIEREWMPESGYNTRMNEDQQLLTVEESKQILYEIEKHKKTLRNFLHQLKIQTETIQKQGQIINELKRKTIATNNHRVPAEGSISLHNREQSSSLSSLMDTSPSKPVIGTGARPKDSSYALNNSRIFNAQSLLKTNSSPVLSPIDESSNTISRGDTLFGQGVKNEYSNFVPLSVDNSSRNFMPSDVGSKFSPSILVSRQSVENSPSVYTQATGIKESTAVIESNHVTDANDIRPKLTAQVCPVCNREFLSMSMEDFQQHVFECIDDGDDEPLQTLQNPTVGDSSGIDRICPMCNKSFSNTLPLGDFEKHVQDHFNEESIVDRFEVLHP